MSRKQPALAKLLAITILGEPAPALADDRPLLSVENIREAEPRALGDLLLPPGHPLIVRAEVMPDAGGSGIGGVALYARTDRLDRGFCRSSVFRVGISPLEYATDEPRYRPHGMTEAAVYRVSRAPEVCEPDTKGYFPISGGSDADGRALVRALIAIKAAAASGARVPATTCSDRSGAKSCTGGSRALLAGIRTDAIGNVALTPCADAKVAAIAACGPQIWLGASGGEAAYWIASFTLRGSGRTMSVARISLVRESVAK